MSRTVGPYPVERLLGRGGDAEVFAGSEPVTGVPVAIKLLREGSSAEQVPRLLREYQFLRDLLLPGLPRARGLGQTRAGRHYLVMDLLPGRPSTPWAEGFASDAARVPRVLRALGRAARLVGAVHGAGVLHGDLKPSSILVGDEDRVALIDFGAGRPRDSQRLVGAIEESFITNAYASLELWRRQVPDAASDVWGLSAIAVRLLLGEPPFGRGTRSEVRKRYGPDALFALSERLAGTVPAPALAAIMRGFAADPGERPAAETWAEAMSLDDAPALAPLSPPEDPTPEPGPATRLGEAVATHARSLLASGAWSSARRHLEAHAPATRAHPIDHAHVLLALADLELGLEHFAVAEDALARVKRLEPRDTELALRTLLLELQLDLALGRSGDLAAAVRVAEGSAARGALAVELAAALALALAEAGDLAAAQAQLARARRAAQGLADPGPALTALSAATVIADASAPPDPDDADEVVRRATEARLFPGLMRLSLARGDTATAWRWAGRFLPQLRPSEALPLRLMPWVVELSARAPA